MSRDITKLPDPTGLEHDTEATAADVQRQSVLESLFDVRAYEEDAPGGSAPMPITFNARAAAAAVASEAAMPHSGKPAQIAAIPADAAEVSDFHTAPAPTAGEDSALWVSDPDDTDFPMPSIASMPTRAVAPSGTRFRSAVHHVASASAALALAAIVAGIGSAAVDAFNALKIDASQLAQPPLEATNSVLAAVNPLAPTPHDRLGFVRSAAFAAAIDRGQPPINVALHQPTQALAAHAPPVELAAAGSRSFAAPNVLEQKVVQVQPAVVAATTPSAPAAINVLNAQGPRPELARAPNMDQIASLLDRAEPAAPQPVLAQRKETLPAGISISPPARDAAAPIVPASAEPIADATAPWETKVVATARGKRLQDEVAAAERAQQMRRNAYALGVKPAAIAADVAGPAIPAPAAKPTDTTPWYLRSPSWSPFNRADAQSR